MDTLDDRGVVGDSLGARRRLHLSRRVAAIVVVIVIRHACGGVVTAVGGWG